MEEGSWGFEPHFLKLSEILGDLSLPSSDMFMLAKFSAMYLTKEGGKGTLLTIEKCYNLMLAFSFYLYYHIRSSNENISFIHAKQWAW